MAYIKKSEITFTKWLIIEVVDRDLSPATTYKLIDPDNRVIVLTKIEASEIVRVLGGMTKDEQK